MLFNLPPELLSSILGFLDLVSLKHSADSCRTLRAVCSHSVLNPWHQPVRRAIHDLFTHPSHATDRGRELVDYPLDVTLSELESASLSILAALGAFSCVPRSVLVDVLTLAPPRFLLYHSTRAKLSRELWEEAFRRRFLPSWIPQWVHRSQRPGWWWQEGFFRVLEQVNHRLTSNCTSTESWTNYVVVLRSGTAATCTAYSRTFSASVIMTDLKRQANLLDYETQARVIVQLADVRIVMLGVLRKPPYYAVNNHARELLHPEGVEKPSEHVLQRQTTDPQPSNPQPSHPPLPPGVFVSPSDSPTRPPQPPLTTSRTRSPSRERRRGTNLRLSRTLTHESTGSTWTTESTSNRSGGIMGRLRRWTYGSNDRPSSPERSASVSISSPLPVSASSPVPSWTTAAPTPNTTMPMNSTPNAVIAETPSPHSNVLPRLQHPEPIASYANYPNYTPGGEDNRWRVQDGLEEGGLVWVGPIMITAQLVPHNTRWMSQTALTADEVYSEGRHVSFRWDDLIAIAPWMEERLNRRDDGLTL